MSWEPILDGVERERALASIDEVAGALRHRYDRAPLQDFSLAHGAAGDALFFGYRFKVTGDENDAETALWLLDQATGALAERPMGEGLYSGFTGIAWAVEHLQGSDDDDVHKSIDDAINSTLGRGPWVGPYDLIGGLAGVGVYLAERWPSPGARRGIPLLIDRLRELSEPAKPGLRWLTPAEELSPWQRERAPDGYYNLGVAHGIPGILGVLGEFCRLDPSNTPARELLEGGLEWLLAQRLPSSAGFAFVSWIAAGGTRENPGSGCAWCYGDPGLVATLFNAARVLGREDLEREATEIGLMSARRPDDEAGVRDAGLCHGAVGLAHLFNRFYQATGNDELRHQARRWYLHALDTRRDDGVAGYLAYSPEDDGTPRWVADAGHLTGAAGCGLGLLAAVTEVEPLWDRCHLCSIPRR